MPATAKQGAGSQPAAPAFTQWMDDFLASYYRHRPVNATFIGEHRYDGQLPDFSEQGLAGCVADMKSLLERLRALPLEALTPAEALDRTVAEGFLRVQLWEYEADHFFRRNPSFYAGEAVFGVIGLLLTPFAPLDERLAAAAERLRAIPGFLRQAQENLREAPAAWTERAIRECDGSLELYHGGIDLLLADEGIDHPQLRAAADLAAKATVGFRAYLRDDLLGGWGRTRPDEGYACGERAFDLLMRKGHFLDLTGAQIVRYAENALAEADAYLASHAADFGAKNMDEALAQLADPHPSADCYYARYRELWEACRAAATEHRLLMWPDFPIEYVPRPRWARGAAPHLYFLFYRSPAAFQRPPVHRYLVSPLDEAATLAEHPAAQEAFLRANNDSVIKLNHVVHHGGIGHHVQNWHAYRAESRIGRIAAVDCASRLAIFGAGTMAEGWACYATNLIAETGFLTPLESYSEYQSRRRMSARAIVDVKLHAGEFTLDQAAGFYESHAGMTPGAARAEAVKNSMFPGAAMMYLYGSDMIHDLRKEMSARQGDRFNLAAFHDRFLSYGSLPVSLIAADMLQEVTVDGRS
jgi:hypothetical protein